MWLNQTRAKQTVVPSILGRQGIDRQEILRRTLAVLPDKSLPKPVRAPPGHCWNLEAGPVIKIPDMPLPVNDNFRAADIALKAA
jgi:hypothetical protein